MYQQITCELIIQLWSLETGHTEPKQPTQSVVPSWCDQAWKDAYVALTTVVFSSMCIIQYNSCVSAILWTIDKAQ